MDKADFRKKGFEIWMEGHNAGEFNHRDEEVLEHSLNKIGISITSIYDIEDSFAIRAYASELLLKRTCCGILDFDQYTRTLQRLISYAEYLDICRLKKDVIHVSSGLNSNNSEKGYQILDSSVIERDTARNAKHSSNLPKSHIHGKVPGQNESNQRTGTNNDEDIIDDALVVAYYLSRRDLDGIKELEYKNFSVAFKELGKILGKKPATIKNMRDEFDPYFDNPRAGWYQRPLRKSRQIVLAKFADVTDEELIKIVRHIICKRKIKETEKSTDITLNKDMNSEKPHKTIKITSSVMKEIKRRKEKKN